MTNREVNGECKCFLCNKKSNSSLRFKEDDYLYLITHYGNLCQDSSKVENKILTEENLKSLEKDFTELINPCKCSNSYVHIPCLIQNCLLQLDFKCDYCGCLYNIDFLDIETNQKFESCFLPQLIIYILLFIICIGASVVLIIIDIFPNNCDFWRYILAAVFLILGCIIGIFTFFFAKNNFELSAKKFPIITDRKEESSKDDEYYNNVKKFLETVLNSDLYDILERKIKVKMYTESTLKSRNKIFDYIKANNSDIRESNLIVEHSTHNSKKALNAFLNNNFYSQKNLNLKLKQSKTKYLKPPIQIVQKRKSVAFESINLLGGLEDIEEIVEKRDKGKNEKSKFQKDKPENDPKEESKKDNMLLINQKEINKNEKENDSKVNLLNTLKG